MYPLPEKEGEQMPQTECERILPYKRLADAVILKAVEDYRELLRCNNPTEKTEIEIGKIEKFFNSEYYRILTNLNGEMLIRKLRKEYEDECKTNSGN